jgi:hypothetical protein
MTVRDYTDVVVRFTDEVGAQVFAKFVALEGIPCHIVDIRDVLRLDRYGVRVPGNRADELSGILQLKPVINHLTPSAAQSIAAQLARAGIPCYVGDADTSLLDESAEDDSEADGFRHLVAVPRAFFEGAARILDKAQPWDAGTPGAMLDTAARDSNRSF